MRTPQSVWETFIAYPDQDMRPFAPFLRQISSGKILEVGVCAGFSTAAFLLGFEDKGDKLSHLVSIDIDPCRIFSHPQWTFIQGASQTVEIPEGPYDIVLIDGDHTYSSVRCDLERFSKEVRPGGIVLAHDVAVEPAWRGRAMSWFDVIGCAKAWDEFVYKNKGQTTILRSQTGMGIWQKPK